MTKNQKQKLIDIFLRIQNQLKFFEDTPEESKELKSSVNDICMEAMDGLRKRRI